MERHCPLLLHISFASSHTHQSVKRMEDERLTKKIYNAKACEGRSRGRPRLTYEDQIKQVLADSEIKSTRH